MIIGSNKMPEICRILSKKKNSSEKIQTTIGMSD